MFFILKFQKKSERKMCSFNTLKLSLYIQRSREYHAEMLAETKKSRVPGKPRHFIDCYLDEMEKVSAKTFQLQWQ